MSAVSPGERAALAMKRRAILGPPHVAPLIAKRTEALRLVGGNRVAADYLLRQALGDLPATARLGDGTIGYYVRPFRTDDCMAPAIATVLQVPLDEVPDPDFDLRVAQGENPDEIEAGAWRILIAWLAERGLQIVHHTTVPIDSARWIGVVGSGQFGGHCLVMSRSAVLFDPVDPRAYERPVRQFASRDVTSGFSFEPI